MSQLLFALLISNRKKEQNLRHIKKISYYMNIIIFLDCHQTLKSAWQIAVWTMIHELTLESIMKELPNAEIWSVGEAACSARSRCLKIILKLQANSVMSEGALTWIVSNPAMGLFLWIKINVFCNIGPIPAKRNLTQAAAQSPVDIGAGMLTHSTDIGIQVNHRTGHISCPKNRNCLSFPLCCQNDSFKQHLIPAYFPPLLQPF